MEFESKKWLNEGDPNINDDTPKLDADSLNRIERNIKEAYDEAKSTKYVDDLVIYLNNSPLTFKRDSEGALVRTTYSCSENVIATKCDFAKGEYKEWIADNFWEFDYIKPEYTVPSFECISKIRFACYANYEFSYKLKNCTLKIKDSSENIIYEHTYFENAFSLEHNHTYSLSSIPWNNMSSGKYLVSLSFQISSSGSAQGFRLDFEGSISHLNRNIIEYPQKTQE